MDRDNVSTGRESGMVTRTAARDKLTFISFFLGLGSNVYLIGP